MINIDELFNDLLSYFFDGGDREVLEPQIKEALENLTREGKEEKQDAEKWHKFQMQWVEEKRKEINERCKELKRGDRGGCNKDCGDCPITWEDEDLSKDYPDELRQSVYLYFRTPRTTERERERQEQYWLDVENGVYDD